MILPNRSGRNQPIVKDTSAPALQPIVPRPDGFLVNFKLGYATFTVAFACTAGRTSVSMKRAYLSDSVSYSTPRSLPISV